MGVEVLGGNITQEQEKVIERDDTSIPEIDRKTNLTSGHGVEKPIKFGSVDSSPEEKAETNETNKVAAAIIPKDAVDEWPVPKEIHNFYFVKYRSYEDPKLKAKIEQAEKDLQKKNQARFQITETLRAKRSERTSVISQLKPLTNDDRRYRMAIDEKRKEMEPLTTALGKLRNANNAPRDKGVGICSSEEELDDLISSLHYRMQHESNTLTEEKQLLKEIRQLEGTRDKVIANAALKTKIQDSLGQKEAIQDQVKLIGVDMDGVRKEQQAVRTKIKHLEEELKAIDDEIISLQNELASVTEKRDKAYETLSEQRKVRDELNGCFYRNRSLLNNVKVLAAKKNIAALRELCHNEVENFMSEWSSNKAFRDDYERRILPSLDIRQLSRDGCMRNPDEKPIMVETHPANMPEPVPSIITAKQVTEDGIPHPHHGVVALQKVQDEVSKSTEADLRRTSDRLMDSGDTNETGRSRELPEAKETDSLKLKEIKREEEVVKAKLAMERKKKLAEKAAAKAAARAQKDAEKKIKEKEKRAKKKVRTFEPASTVDEAEIDAKALEPEAEAKPDAVVPANAKEQKEKVKSRKVPNVLPKAILRRKKSQAYWTWAASAATLAVIFSVVCWYQFSW